MTRSLVTLVTILFVLPACEVVGGKRSTRDTGSADTTRVPGDTARRDSARPPALGARDSFPTDTGVVRVDPTSPRRGDVIFALAEGLRLESARCTWRGQSLPCFTVPTGVRAFIPLSSDDPAGTYTLTIDRPASRIARSIAVAERDFGREFVFLPESLYAKVRNADAVARDARAVRQVLTGTTPEQFWRGRWRMPVIGGTSGGYGAERFYLRATDSARVLTLGPTMKVRGGFAADTMTSNLGDAPGWRHAGVDIAVPKGTSVRAPATGVVAAIGDYILSGRTLILNHGQGVYSAYFHLDTILVRPGDEIRQGATVARVGATGLATGPHLHYGIYVNGRDVDPASWHQMPDFARGDSVRATVRRGESQGSRQD